MEKKDSPFGKLTKQQEDNAYLIAKTAEEMNLDPDLALAIGWAESRFLGGVSSAGARGLMQVMPENAPRLGLSVEDLDDPQKNVRAGLTILQQNLDRFKGNEILAIAGYNTRFKTGEKFAETKDPNDLPAATRAYLDEIDSFRPLQTAPVKPPTAAEQILEEREARGEAPQDEGMPPEDKALITGGLGAAKGVVELGLPKPESISFAEFNRARNNLLAAQSQLSQLERAAAQMPSSKEAQSALNAARSAVEAARQEVLTIQDQLKTKTVAPPAPPAPAPPAPPAQQLAASTVPSSAEDMHTRGIQGTTKETGITGRASQTTYNERTAQIARQQLAQQAALEKLGRQGIIDPAKALQLTEGISASTPSGILVDPEVRAALEQELAEKQAQQAQQQGKMETKEAQERMRREQELREAQRRVRESGAKVSEASQSAKKSAAMEEKVAAQQRKAQTAKELLAEAKKQYRGPLSDIGVKVGSSKIFGPLLGGLAAAGTTMSLEEAIRRYRAGDYSGAVLPTLEAAFGAMSMVPPVTPVSAGIKGLGTVGGLALGLGELGYAGIKELRDMYKEYQAGKD